ncbi:MAG: hypothetical protein WC220_03975 [Pedobacter sp.]|jgi:hypothetical protein
MAVLITAAAYAAAFKLERMLNTSEVYFGEQVDMPAISGKVFLRLPGALTSSFTSEMLKICLDHGITDVFPLKSDEVVELSKARQLFEEYGIRLIIPSNKWIQNQLNDSFPNSSNILILSGEKVIAGELPGNSSLPENEESGIFSWDLKDGVIRYHLFKVDHAEI